MSSKVREALTKVSDVLETWCDHLPPIIQDVAKEALALADEALAEPIRNCDVGDAYEQEKRFARWRKSEGCDSYPEIVLRWSQKSYEEGETK